MRRTKASQTRSAQPLPAACVEGVEIVEVAPRSQAWRVGLRPGCRLLNVNGETIRDTLDLVFHGSDPALELAWRDAAGERREAGIVRKPGAGIGFRIEDMRTQRCRNKCVFCFIDQNPPGLRESLYVKDEDYRLSFIHGHYITGASLGPAELRRVVAQRLSPLYLSVHATNHELRCRMLGRPADKTRPVMEILEYLKKRRVQFHAQIVLCPGWNDGGELERSLDELEGLVPALLSVAVVPVGLTAHRAGLPPLKSVSPEEAGRIIDQIEPRQARQLEELGERITLLADEFYLLAERPLPDYSEEEREFQIENGVGMVSDFWEGWKGGKRLMNRLALDLTAPTRAAILTGKLGSRALAPLVERLRGLSNLQIDLIEMENSLYGPEVTVSGLLPGRDFDAAIGRTEAGLVLLPGNSLRAEDERFLDDLTLEDLRRAHPERRIEAVENSATAIVDAIRDYTKSTRPSP